jgi:hypothetical protein
MSTRVNVSLVSGSFFGRGGVMRVVRMMAVAVALAVVLGASAAHAFSYDWDGTSNDWSPAGHWTGDGGLPDGSDDAGAINSGTADANVDLGSAGDRPTITVATGGILHQPGTTNTVNCPIVMDGGTWVSATSWLGDGSKSKYLTGGVTLNSDSYFKGRRSNKLYVNSLVDGSGKFIASSVDEYKSVGLTIYLSQTNTYDGGTLMTGTKQIVVVANADEALGTGDIDVNKGTLVFGANQTYAAPPTVNVNGGAVQLSGDNRSVNMPLVYGASGGGLSVPNGTQDTVVSGTVTLNGTMTYSNRRASGYTALKINNTVSGNGSIVVNSTDMYDGSRGALELAATNSYDGGTTVTSGGLRATADQALGDGTVTVNTGGIGGKYGWYLQGGLSVETQQTYGAQPLVQANSGGSVYINTASGVDVDLDVTLNGGEVCGSWSADGRNNGLAGTVTLIADSYVGGARGTGSLDISGQITGAYSLTKQRNNRLNDSTSSYGASPRNLGGAIILSNSTNDYTGGTFIEYGTLIAAAAGSLGTGDVVVFGDAELEVDADGALAPGAVLYLLAGSVGLLDLNVDATVYALTLGGTWDGTEVIDIQAEIAPGTYTEATFAAEYASYVDYIDFATGTTSLRVLTGPLPVAEPAGLGLIGLALLGLKKKRS